MSFLVITGASGGIGEAAAIELTRCGHQVLALGRSTSKLAKVYRRMQAVAHPQLDVPVPIAAELAAMSEVRRVAALLLERCSRIDVLVNNAGIQPTRRCLSPDGYELALAVNHLAPFLLTNLLVDRLRLSAGRVVTTSSSNHADGEFDFSDLQLSNGWSSKGAYGRSKLANILFTIELRTRTGLPASCFHPGSIATDLSRDVRFRHVVQLFENLAYGRPKDGADSLVWLATSAEGAAPTAPYYVKRQPAEISARASDRELAARLWETSAQLVGLAAA